MSITIPAVIVMLLVNVLPLIGINIGSDALQQALQTDITLVLGIVVWVRRIQQGDVKLFGAKK